MLKFASHKDSKTNQFSYLNDKLALKDSKENNFFISHIKDDIQWSMYKKKTMATLFPQIKHIFNIVKDLLTSTELYIWW